VRRAKPWPHKNGPRDVAARQAAVRAVPGWGPADDVVLQFPAGPGAAEAFAAVQECLTGYVALPVATVPLLVNLGRYVLDERGAVVEQGRETAEVLVPLAHTEGGLSASMLRGAKAARAAGGVRTYVLADRMTRASCFRFEDTAQALAFARWVEAHSAEMARWLQDPDNPLARQQASSGVRLLSRHAILREVRTHVLGRTCHVLYRFTTGDACGPNMITRNAQALNKHFIARRFPAETGIAVRRPILEANMGGDKKPSYEYFHEGHGKTVVAEVTLSDHLLRRFLKCSAEEVVALEHIGLHGSHASGMQSAAFTPASAIAAIFAATGQDLGMVGTSSMAHSTAELTAQGDVHLSIRLPGLEVGTVGGGAVLPHARAWLKVMGCAGPGQVYRFAQIVAAATLCLEVSAAAAMAADGSENFYQAHLERGGLRTRWSAGPAEPVAAEGPGLGSRVAP
jgi:hydroxymethylglutaryl-CoA reductase (NADPH)